MNSCAQYLYSSFHKKQLLHVLWPIIRNWVEKPIISTLVLLKNGWVWGFGFGVWGSGLGFSTKMTSAVSPPISLKTCSKKPLHITKGWAKYGNPSSQCKGIISFRKCRGTPRGYPTGKNKIRRPPKPQTPNPKPFFWGGGA